MLDNLAKIRHILDEHQTIKRHVKLVGDTVADQEALNTLERLRFDWVPGQLVILAERQKNLEQAMSFLDDGLRNHFAYEEQVLPPLLGELFMRALILDHQQIKKEINEAKEVSADKKLGGLSREELLSKELHIQQVAHRLSRLVEAHATREETILEMVQRALEDKGQNKDEQKCAIE